SLTQSRRNGWLHRLLLHTFEVPGTKVPCTAQLCHAPYNYAPQTAKNMSWRPEIWQSDNYVHRTTMHLRQPKT
ncbi:MAG: hypothetical protein KDB01_14185, partial [Planctomycetaceae bacterium]|nr:hypothetical protein [Planctomycetaceae bacterium]